MQLKRSSSLRKMDDKKHVMMPKGKVIIFLFQASVSFLHSRLHDRFTFGHDGFFPLWPEQAVVCGMR